MITIEILETFYDRQLICQFKGKFVKIQYRDCHSQNGVVTNFICAAQASNPDRTIVGFTINDNEDIIFSSETISFIEVIQ